MATTLARARWLNVGRLDRCGGLTSGVEGELSEEDISGSGGSSVSSVARAAEEV